MAVLSAAERNRWSRWPDEISHGDLVAYFTLTVDDVRWLRGLRVPDAARLALAVQRCALGYLGWVPTDLPDTPGPVVQRLADAIGMPPAALELAIKPWGAWRP